MEAPFDFEGKGRVVKGAPYSAQTVTENTRTLADGNRHVERTEGAVYRDGEGRTRREHTTAGPGARPGLAKPNRRVITIDDVVAGVHYVLDLEAKTARRMPRWEGRPHAGRVPGQPIDRIDPNSTERVGASPRRESLGRRTIEGLEAEGTRTTVIVGPGEAGNDLPIEIVTDRWVSPALQAPVLVRFSDPRVGERVYRLLRIVRAEPSPQLFVVPPEFTRVDGPERLMRRKHVP
jgi:hypothetical protein